jgi:DNA-binding MarR family transcriptional regulator
MKRGDLLLDDLERDAIRLESMLPRITRFLFRHGTSDPLSHLSVAQIRMIRLLAGQSRIAADLSAELGMTPSAVSQATHRLERMGLIERHADVQDRRIKRLALSPLGTRLMSERQSLRVSRARTALDGLSETHRRRLISSLDELLCALGPGMTVEPDPLALVAELEQTLPPVPPFVPPVPSPTL